MTLARRLAAAGLAATALLAALPAHLAGASSQARLALGALALGALGLAAAARLPRAAALLLGAASLGALWASLPVARAHLGVVGAILLALAAGAAGLRA